MIALHTLLADANLTLIRVANSPWTRFAYMLVMKVTKLAIRFTMIALAAGMLYQAGHSEDIGFVSATRTVTNVKNMQGFAESGELKHWSFDHVRLNYAHETNGKMGYQYRCHLTRTWFDPSARVRPYATGGLHMLQFQGHNMFAAPINPHVANLNYGVAGGGLKFKLSTNWEMRIGITYQSR